MLRPFRTRLIRGFVFGAMALALVSSAYADNVNAKVKNGHLTLTGQVGGDVEVTITPTATGIQIEGVDTTTINGSGDPFVTDEVTRDWRLRFARTDRVRLTVNGPSGEDPRASVRKLNFFAGINAGLVLNQVDVESNLKVDLARARQNASLEIVGCSVGKSIKAKIGVRDEIDTVAIADTTVAKALKVNAVAQVGTAGRNTDFVFTDLTLGSMSLGVKVNSSNVTMERCDVAGNLNFRADMDLFLDDVGVGGNFSAKANLHEQELFIESLDVTGKAVIVVGVEDDLIDINGSTFGKLIVTTGKGNDELVTADSVLGTKSKYDGSFGNDSWRTTGALNEIKTVRVEDIDTLE